VLLLIQVGLLSPSLAVRVGLRALLEADVQIAVVAEAGSLHEFIDYPSQLDVLIITSESLTVEPDDPISVNNLFEPAVLIIGNTSAILPALPRFGRVAWGVLAQEASQEELLAAVHALDQGLIVGDPSMMLSLIGPSLQADARAIDGAVESLTERELEVLQLLAQGMANKQIAAQLGISTHTVKFHISSIYGKLGATNRTEAVRIGLQSGLILL
jgi:DNA-binding NarL/FixJ family response regulator